MPSNQMLAITTEDSNDDFEPPCKRAKLQVQDDKMDIPAYESAISALLPDDYFLRCQHMIVMTGSNAHLEY
jgi:hypothetical protein